MGTEVIIKQLKTSHQNESFTTFQPLRKELVTEINQSVSDIFDRMGGSSLLKSGGDVYIKPNAVDAKPYAFTRIEVLRAIIDYWKKRAQRNCFFLKMQPRPTLPGLYIMVPDI